VFSFVRRKAATMPSIFISYRRDDTEVYADRMADDLRRQFGEDEVFIDRETLGVWVTGEG
jgi:hypothetical protein